MSRYMKRRNLGLLLALAMLVLVAGLGFGARSSSLAAANKAPANPHQAARPSLQQSGLGVASTTSRAATKLSNGITIVSDDKHDTSIALRDMKPAAPLPGRKENESALHANQLPKVTAPKKFSDPVLQKSFGPLVMPTPLVTFEGLGANGSIPPDTNGDIGPNHYVQWINTQFAVYNRAGTRLLGPLPGNTLWSGFGGPCQTTNDGDPIALYDQMADRWMMSQFAFPNFPSGPFYQCIAVSQTGDPTGQWYRYQFTISPTKLNDYPHFGIWPDAYYMTDNLFTGANLDYAGSGQYAFDRTRMLAGQAATVQIHELGPDDWGGMMPSDLDGTTLPPAGAANTFVEVNADEWSYPPYTYRDELQIWQFHVDWQNPGNTTFTGPVLRPTAPFDGMPCANPNGTCIHQPGTSQMLDTLYDRDMYRLAYRNLGDHEALVFNHTVDADGANNGYTGVRWYEIRSPRNNPIIFQQGTYAPDSVSRWMGSMAMDHNGNIAVGFSVSDATSTYPGIRYAGRLANDPPGQLGQGEAVMQAGNGSQTGYSRWGDYSMLSLDPTDDCTFWYTNEYYPTTSGGGFHTRIGSFKFPSCTSGSGTSTPTNTPGGFTPTRTNTPPVVTNTPTPCGTGGGWAAGPTMPSALVRGVGVWYPNGLNRFYVMGGRSSDTAGSDLQNPRYFDTSSSTWTVDTAASFPDNQVNNMACADLSGSGGHRIYCVGGSAAGATTSSSAVRMYDPAAHTITALSSDNWPATANTLPGGFAVVNNKLYILGGFTINVGMSRQIWVFDPNGTAGARWTLKAGQVPDPNGGGGLGYIPAAAIGTVIYTGGGSHWDPTTSTIADDPKTFSYDTVSDTVSDTAVPDMPAPGDAETRAVNMGGKVWVIGGGRTAPNPTSNVMQFDPSNPSAGWTMVNSFTGARRNFPVDVDPATGKIYLAGGYMPSTPTDTMQIYQPPQTCGTSTPTPNRTNTPTNTTVRTSTMTVTPIRTTTGTVTPIRTNTGTPGRTITITPNRTITPCAGCNMDMLAVVTSCYLDGTVHWIAIAHNPDPCGVNAPWRAELQVRNNNGNFRTVRIQYATNYFGSGDNIMDGYFCYHFSSNVRDVRVEFLFEDQDRRSQGSNDKVQERGAPANSYSTTPDSGIPVAKSGTGDSPTQCDADMASHPMAPCQSNDSCSPPPSPIPTGVATRAPVLPTK